jgi:hypothetical protein
MGFVKKNWKEWGGLVFALALFGYSLNDWPLAWPATILWGGAAVGLVVLLIQLYRKQHGDNI